MVVKSSSSNLLISRIVEFDEFAIPFEVRELVVAVKDPDVCKKVELSVETSDKIFGSIIFLVISKERRLPHWYGFAKLVFSCISYDRYDNQIG